MTGNIPAVSRNHTGRVVVYARMLMHLGPDDCHRAFAGRLLLCLVAAAVVAVLMLWLSASQLRRRPLRRLELCLVLALGVALVVWAARQVASEPVLVSGHLNVGVAAGLAFFSLWLAFLGVRARKRGPTQSAVLACCGAAILIGATSGWTWRAMQPCKRHYASVVGHPKAAAWARLP